MTGPQKKNERSAKVNLPLSKRLWNWGLLFLICLLIGGMGTIWMGYYLYPFLALSHPVEDPDAIIVEGWLPFHALQAVFEQSQKDSTLKVVVPGAARGHTEFTLGGHPQSGWAADVSGIFSVPPYADTLFIIARGNLVNGAYGHIQVYVNERRIGDFTVSDTPQQLAFALPFEEFGFPKRVSLRMENTLFSPSKEMRQVYLQRLALDTLALPLFGPHSFYSFSVEGGQRFEVSQEENVAVVAGKILEKMGLSKHRLAVLPYEAKQGSRTLEGAKTVAEWIQRSDYPIQSINLYSQAAHARRSFEMYQKTLPDSIHLGVTALSDYRYDENWLSHPMGRRLVLEQLFKYLFYKIVFIR